MSAIATGWPPAWGNFVEAPAGEPATAGWMPNTEQLDWAHKILQVTFMGLALIGLFVLLAGYGPVAVVRGAARRHAVA